MMPDKVEGVRGKDIHSSDIFMDDYVIKELISHQVMFF